MVFMKAAVGKVPKLVIGIFRDLIGKLSQQFSHFPFIVFIRTQRFVNCSVSMEQKGNLLPLRDTGFLGMSQPSQIAVVEECDYILWKGIYSHHRRNQQK